MKKKSIAVILAAILFVSIFVFFPRYNDRDDYNTNAQEPLTDGNETLTPPVEKIVYNNILLIDQQNEKLNGEAVQYKITFHDDDVVSYQMNISYHLTDPGVVFYLVYLTDGVNTETIHLSDEAYGSLVDVTTFIKHRKMGKRVNAYGETSYSNTRFVKNNSVLYLTIAVKSDSGEENLTVLFETEKNTMDLTRLNRTDGVYLSSALDADYKNGKLIGRYRGYSLFGLGASHGSINKKIPVSNGGIICVDMKNYYQGMMKVSTVSGSKSSESYEPREASILLSTTYNGTGAWVVEANTFGFPKKSSLLSFVVDVNPHSSITVNDWNGTKPQTIENKLDSLSTKLMQWGITELIKIFKRER